MTSLRAASPETNALLHPKFVLYLIAVGCTSFAVQIMSVSVGWEIYDITRDPIYLGYVGLAQFLPPLLLVLVTGLAADRFNRRFIMAACLSLEALCALGLLLFTLSNPTNVTPVFGILVVLGIARAFMNPASDALAPNLVPKEAIAHAISLTTMIWQTANIAGPVAGGLLYGLAGEVAQDAFVGIHRRFRDLTMRAYLGVIDVSWEEKETLTHRIEELFEQRNEALRILDADFSELLEEP